MNIMCKSYNASKHRYARTQTHFHHRAPNAPQIILLAHTNNLFICPGLDLLLSAEASLHIKSQWRCLKFVFWEM